METPFLARVRRLNQNAIAAGRRAEEAARRRRRAPILPIGAVVIEEAQVVTLLCVIASVMRHRSHRPAIRRGGRRFAPSATSGRSRRKPP